MPTNPYMAPADAPDLEDHPRRFHLAGRGRRLAAAVVDLLVAVSIPSFPAAVLGAGVPWGARILVGLMPLGVQAVLIARSGQSAGKMLLKTRIVLADGRPAGLLRGFVLRSLTVIAVAALPEVMRAAHLIRAAPVSPELFFWMVFAVDALPIFGVQRRCLHDRLAGTFVSAVASERLDEDAGAPPRRRKKRRVRAGSPGSG